MRVGLVHLYWLSGSGSCVFARSLARHLSRGGLPLHILSTEPHPENFSYIREAWTHSMDHSARLFRRPHITDGCVAHTLHFPFQLVSYARAEMDDNGYRFITDLRDQELDRFLGESGELIRRICMSQGLDLLHVNHALPLSYVANFLRPFTDVPYVVTIHGSMIEYAAKRDTRLLELARTGLEGAEAVVILNQDGRRRVLEIAPELESKIVIIPSGVDAENFQPVGAERGRFVEENTFKHIQSGTLGRGPTRQEEAMELARSHPTDAAILRWLRNVPTGVVQTSADANLHEKLMRVDWERDLIVTFVGKLIPDKGAHMLLSVLPAVMRAVPNVRFLFIGNGFFREVLELMAAALDNADKALLERLVRLAPEVDPHSKELAHLRHYLATLDPETLHSLRGRIRERVIFTGYLTHAQLAHLLPLSHLCAIPSLVPEAYPLVFLEALSSGVIPVGSHIGGLGDVFDDLAEYIPSLKHLASFDHSPPTLGADLADRLCTLLDRIASDKEYHRLHQRRCWEFVQENLTWKSVARRFADLYEEVLGRNAAVPYLFKYQDQQSLIRH